MPNLKAKNKLNLSLFPATALAHASFALMDGAWKYVAYNYRDTEVPAAEYVSAIKRHIDLWFEREGDAPDSKAHHLGHAIAGLAILIDAEASGCLVDDRPKRNALRKVLDQLTKKIEERNDNLRVRTKRNGVRSTGGPVRVLRKGRGKRVGRGRTR